MSKAKKFSETKIGKVSNIKWAYITQVKLGREADLNQYLVKVLDIISKGTRYREHIDAMKNARQIKRRKRQ